MKRAFKMLIILAATSVMFSSCATVLGGKITSCQEKKPDQPRQVRVTYLVVDVICGIVPVGIDFLTKAIYKPCRDGNQPK